jgi:hypothetical protein
MSILGCYGEDIDFVAPSSLQVRTDTMRAGYARCAFCCATGTRTLPFAGGVVTSAWLSWIASFNSGDTNRRWIGLINSATPSSGLWFGPGASSNKAAIFKYDGTTLTTLATEAGATLGPGIANLFTAKFDMQIVNYGASSVVNLFINGALVISYSGSTAISGVSNLDCVGLAGPNSNGNGTMSEIIVADEDTRSFSLFVMAPTAAGTTDNWTGAVTTINGTSFSDASPNFTNTAAQDQQANITDPPTGIFGVKAVKIAARAAASVGSTPTKIKLGYNSGGSVAVGAAQTLTNSYTTYEQLDVTNPVTSAAWAFSDLAALQLDLRSST